MAENNHLAIIFCFECKITYKSGKFCSQCGKHLLEPVSLQQKKQAIDIIIEETTSKLDWCKSKHTSEQGSKKNCPNCDELEIEAYRTIKKIQDVGESIVQSFDTTEIENIKK